MDRDAAKPRPVRTHEGLRPTQEPTRRKPMKQMLCAAALSTAMLAGPAVAQVSDDVVRIGILNDQSGVYADFGGKWSVEAAKMAAEDFGGKVLDKPIDIVTADHQNKPDVVLTVARRWYDVEKVDAIME